MPKAVVSYRPALVIVHLSKPAHCREVVIIYKTGGDNSDAGSCGKNVCLCSREGKTGKQRVTGGADLTTKPAQLTGMRKGSVQVRGVATKGLYAV